MYQNKTPVSQTAGKKTIGEYQYNFADMIGEGQYSRVYLGKHVPTNQQVAIKVIENSKVFNEVGLVLLQNEHKTLKQCQSEHILKFYSFVQTENHLYFITEYCNQGDLTRNTSMSQQAIVQLMYELLLALQELKNKGIVHRDIKPANIMLHNGVLKLADFGFSIQLQQKPQLQNLRFGTPLYMAPECTFQNQYSYQSDIWSAGITLYKLMFGQVPFYHSEEKKLRILLADYTRNPNINLPDSPLTNLLRLMLDPNPNTRATLDELLRMPLFNQFETTSPLGSTDCEETEKAKVRLKKKRYVSLAATRFSTETHTTGDRLASCQSPQRESMSEYDWLFRFANLAKSIERSLERDLLQWCIIKVLLQQQDLNDLEYQMASFEYKYLTQEGQIQQSIAKAVHGWNDPLLKELVAIQYKCNQRFYALMLQLLGKLKPSIAQSNKQISKSFEQFEKFVSSLAAHSNQF